MTNTSILNRIIFMHQTKAKYEWQKLTIASEVEAADVEGSKPAVPRPNLAAPPASWIQYHQMGDILFSRLHGTVTRCVSLLSFVVTKYLRMST